MPYGPSSSLSINFFQCLATPTGISFYLQLGAGHTLKAEYTADMTFRVTGNTREGKAALARILGSDAEDCQHIVTVLFRWPSDLARAQLRRAHPAHQGLMHQAALNDLGIGEPTGSMNRSRLADYRALGRMADARARHRIENGEGRRQW